MIRHKGFHYELSVNIFAFKQEQAIIQPLVVVGWEGAGGPLWAQGFLQAHSCREVLHLFVRQALLAEIQDAIF